MEDLWTTGSVYLTLYYQKNIKSHKNVTKDCVFWETCARINSVLVFHGFKILGIYQKLSVILIYAFSFWTHFFLTSGWMIF